MSTPTFVQVDRSVADLAANTINPRTLKDKAFKELKESLDKDREFIKARPIIVSMAEGRENTVIAGNMRLQAIKSLGWATVPVVEVRDASVEQEKEWMVKDNLHKGEWDFEMLANNFDLAFLMEMGFDEKGLAKVQQKQQKGDDEFDLDGALEEAAETGIERGEIFQLGEHRLICGDSTDQKTYAALFGSQKAALIFTDPPYNIGYEGGMNTHGQNKRSKIENDKMSKESFYEFLNSFIELSMKYSEGGWYVCMSSQEIDALKRSFEANGGHWQSFIIWAKHTFTLSRSDWQNQYEPILYGWNSDIKKHFYVGWRDEGNVWEEIENLKPTFEGGKTKIRVAGYELEIEGDATKGQVRKLDETDVWRFKKPSKSDIHPTMKPVELVEKAVMASSVLKDIVFDPFLGSGTTLIACENLGRVCYGIEYEPKYCAAIIKRWEEKTGKKASKISLN